jgi:hypothetical protein
LCEMTERKDDGNIFEAGGCVVFYWIGAAALGADGAWVRGAVFRDWGVGGGDCLFICAYFAEYAAPYFSDNLGGVAIVPEEVSDGHI